MACYAVLWHAVLCCAVQTPQDSWTAGPCECAIGRQAVEDSSTADAQAALQAETWCLKHIGAIQTGDFLLPQDPILAPYLLRTRLMLFD